MKHATVLKMGLLSLALAGIVACGKKGADGASVNAGRDTRVSGNPNLPTGQGGMVGTQSALINFSGQQAAMKEAIQVLVSPTLEAGSVGEIQEVRVSGNVGFQSNGQILNTSGLEIVIRDSYTLPTEGNEPMEPILIRIQGASGTAVGNNANLVFSDSYGTITVTGTYTASQFTGTVKFRNNSPGYLGRIEGTLGTFSIATCAFFRCM